jgi:hypothetical protein
VSWPSAEPGLDYSLTWQEALAVHEPGARLILTDGEGFAAVHIPWGNRCPTHGLARDLCRCGFPNGEPIGNSPSNGLTAADREWIRAHPPDDFQKRTDEIVADIGQRIATCHERVACATCGAPTGVKCVRKGAMWGAAPALKHPHASRLHADGLPLR